MSEVLNNDGCDEQSPMVVMGKIMHALIQLRAVDPQSSVMSPDLCEAANISMMELAMHGNRIAGDGFVVMPLRRSGGFFSGTYLCSDPDVVEVASRDLQRQAARAESQATFYRNAAERMRQYAGAQAEQDSEAQDEKTA